MEFNWFDHFFAALILFVIPMMSVKSDKLSEDMIAALPPKKHLFYSNGLMLIIGALLVITSWNLSGRPWSKMGFDWILSSPAVWYLCLLILALYYLDLLIGFVNQKYLKTKLEDLHYIIPNSWNEFRPYIFLATAAGICEEIVFRGFLISYIQFYLSDVWWGIYVAILVPALVFSLSHLYQGWWAVLKIILLAILFGLIFVLSGSLILVILIHILIDISSGIAGVLAYKKNEMN